MSDKIKITAFEDDDGHGSFEFYEDGDIKVGSMYSSDPIKLCQASGNGIYMDWDEEHESMVIMDGYKTVIVIEYAEAELIEVSREYARKLWDCFQKMGFVVE